MAPTLRPIDPSILHIRPRFNFVVPGPPEKVLSRIDALLAENPPHIIGQIVDHHVILDIDESERHYWSPQLNFRVESDPDKPEHAVVAGLIGPRPAVWTLFMFGYFAIGVLGFVISSHGVSKWMLDSYAHTIWAFPIAVLIMFTAYRAGKYGEQLGADQVEELKDFVRKAVAPFQPS